MGSPLQLLSLLQSHLYMLKIVLVYSFITLARRLVLLNNCQALFLTIWAFQFHVIVNQARFLIRVLREILGLVKLPPFPVALQKMSLIH
uniref:Type B response regulator RRB2c n=1 Tax=Nicotiana attenuata TaxID=49451 RepID=A0A0A1WCA1_NICAT